MMMMMGEGAHHHHHPTVRAPPWAFFDDPTEAGPYSLPVSGVTGGGGDYNHYLLGEEALDALQPYLPSNEPYSADADSDELDLADAPVSAYSCDEFRMYEFKVRRCARGRSHDWTECPYAHPGEKARRRDPRKFRYCGTACPDFRKGNCKRGESCEFAHGVFECWLHPERYRTQPCKDGTACRRRVCFFAHTPEQLRVLPTPHQQQSPRALAPESYDGSPLRRLALDAYFPKALFPTTPTSAMVSPSSSPTTDSPPASPSGDVLRRASWPVGGSAMNELVASMRHLQLNKMKSMPSSWGFQAGSGGVFGSPRAGGGVTAGFCSLPSTPKSTTGVGGGTGWLDGGCVEEEEEEPTERVESGRALRAKMFEKLSKESGLERLEAAGSGPDVGWVSELIK